MIPDPIVFTHVDYAPSTGKPNILTLTTRDGKKHILSYRQKDQNTPLSEKNAEITVEKQLTALFDRSELEGFASSLHLNLDQTVELLGEKLGQAIRDEKKERIARYGTRTFHLLTGLLITPFEMALGVIKIAIAVTIVAFKVLFTVSVFVAAKLGLERCKKIIAERPENYYLSFIDSVIWDVRVGLLKLIPVVGAQLAIQYRMTGSLYGFWDTPAFGGMLELLDLTIPRIVFGRPIGESLIRKDGQFFSGGDEKLQLFTDDEYLNLKSPSVDETRAQIEKYKDSGPIFVRIPFVNELGEQSRHDATMLVKPGNDASSKSVVIYHGRRSHRDHRPLSYAKYYLDQGYNVLLPSYAGDKVFDHGKNIETYASEKNLHEDARGDGKFLLDLGVTTVAVHGYSLGGAQGMNFVQGLAPEQNVEFIVLERTFTNMVDVCVRLAHNRTRSQFFSRLVGDFTRRFIHNEKVRDITHRCDGLNTEQKLRKFCQKSSATKICIVGTQFDEIMTDMARPITNFANTLIRAAENVVSDIFLMDGSHKTELNFQPIGQFLFPEEGTAY